MCSVGYCIDVTRKLCPLWRFRVATDELRTVYTRRNILRKMMRSHVIILSKKETLFSLLGINVVTCFLVLFILRYVCGVVFIFISFVCLMLLHSKEH